MSVTVERRGKLTFVFFRQFLESCEPEQFEANLSGLWKHDWSSFHCSSLLFDFTSLYYSTTIQKFGVSKIFYILLLSIGPMN